VIRHVSAEVPEFTVKAGKHVSETERDVLGFDGTGPYDVSEIRDKYIATLPAELNIDKWCQISESPNLAAQAQEGIDKTFPLTMPEVNIDEMDRMYLHFRAWMGLPYDHETNQVQVMCAQDITEVPTKTGGNTSVGVSSILGRFEKGVKKQDCEFRTTTAIGTLYKLISDGLVEPPDFYFDIKPKYEVLKSKFDDETKNKKMRLFVISNMKHMRITDCFFGAVIKKDACLGGRSAQELSQKHGGNVKIFYTFAQMLAKEFDIDMDQAVQFLKNSWASCIDQSNYDVHVNAQLALPYYYELYINVGDTFANRSPTTQVDNKIMIAAMAASCNPTILTGQSTGISGPRTASGGKLTISKNTRTMGFANDLTILYIKDHANAFGNEECTCKKCEVLRVESDYFGFKFDAMTLFFMELYCDTGDDDWGACPSKEDAPAMTQIRADYRTHICGLPTKHDHKPMVGNLEDTCGTKSADFLQICLKECAHPDTEEMMIAPYRATGRLCGKLFHSSNHLISLLQTLRIGPLLCGHNREAYDIMKGFYDILEERKRQLVADGLWNDEDEKKAEEAAVDEFRQRAGTNFVPESFPTFEDAVMFVMPQHKDLERQLKENEIYHLMHISPKLLQSSTLENLV